jgi:alkylation response protein AidB-like acyl-CoA dehydrogenase
MKPVDLRQLPSVTRALAKTARAYDESAAFPRAGPEAVHEAGLLTATVGETYGGPGLGLAGLTRILLALGRGDPSVAVIAAMTQLPHLLQARRPTWPEALYRRVLADSAARRTLLNTLRVEPELGSPSRGGRPATVARRTGKGWQISGHKRFATGAAGLAYLLVFATTTRRIIANRHAVACVIAEIGVANRRRGEQTWGCAGMRHAADEEAAPCSRCE